MKTEISRDDILPMDEYARRRPELRRRLVEMKKHRRIDIGPYATLYFENYETMWSQIHEMLFIEKGGAAQIAGELEAFNPLIPKGRELVATLMFEIEDEDRRHRILAKLGGVEHTVTISLDVEVVTGVPEADVERSTAEGKASSVHFLHFPFTEHRIALFRDPRTVVVVGISHPNYGHMAVLPEAVRHALAGDFAV